MTKIKDFQNLWIIIAIVIAVIILCSMNKKEGFWVSPECACSCNYGQPNFGLNNGGRKKKVYSTAFGYYSP